MKTKILAWALACLLPLNAIADKVEVTVNSTGVTEEFLSYKGASETHLDGYTSIQDAAKCSPLNTALAAINPDYDLTNAENEGWKDITSLKINGTINYADCIVLRWLNGYIATKEPHTISDKTGGNLKTLDMSNASFAAETLGIGNPKTFWYPIYFSWSSYYSDNYLTYAGFKVEWTWSVQIHTEEELLSQFTNAIPQYGLSNYVSWDSVIINPNTKKIQNRGVSGNKIYLTPLQVVETVKFSTFNTTASIKGNVKEAYTPMSVLDGYRNILLFESNPNNGYKMGERLYPMLQYGKEWRTFSFDKDLDFTDIHGLYNEANRLEAYIVTGYDAESNTLTLEPAGKLPAGTGVLIRGTGVDGELYPIPATSEATVPTVNLLVGNGYVEDESTKEEVPTHGINTTNYVLKDGEFRYCTGGILPNYKCYLSLPELIPVGDEAGAGEAKPFSFVIAERPATPSESETVTTIRQANGSITTDAAVYDLQGRKMSNSQPLTGGIYIKNGKKFVVR